MESGPTTTPSHYHLLRRLVSLCYNSSPRTSYFYAALLFDLYNEELLNGLILPVVVASGEELDDDADTVHGDSPIKSRVRGKLIRSRNGSSTASLDMGKHDVLNGGKIEMVDIPKHLALHIKGWSFVNNAELYSAIHLVKEHIARSHEHLDTKTRWESESGTLEALVASTMSSDDEDDDNLEARQQGRRASSKSKGKGKERATIEQQDLPCLECAMIYSRACEGLARFEEGRSVLERTIRTLEQGLDGEEFQRHMSTPPSPIPINPLTPRLQLARLLSASNVHKLAFVKQEEDKENQGVGAKRQEGKGRSTGAGESDNTPARYLEQVLKVDGRGKGDGEWCWEAWETFCELGERWTYAESPFSEPTRSAPVEPFPSHLLPLPPTLTNNELSNLLQSFSAASLGSTAGSTHALSGMGGSLNRIQTASSAQSISDVPSSPPTESSGPGSSKDTRGTPRRKMSPLPQHSPLVKAAHAGYPVSPPGVGAGLFTPVGNAVGVGAGAGGAMAVAGGGGGLFAGAPARPGKGKGRAVIRAESPPGDISFPDLSYYGSGDTRPDSYLLPGVRTPVDGHFARGTKTTHPLPSIASQLFPQASKDGSSTFGFGETPANKIGVASSSSYEPGIGKPPVAKRPRGGRAGELRGDEGARNATGRNVSGKGVDIDHAPVRRSARLQENQQPTKFQAPVKPLQTRADGRSRVAPLELHKPLNTNAIRQPPVSPPTSTGGPPSSPPQSRLGRAETTPAPQRPRPDVLAIQQQTADSWLMCLVRRCAAAYFELSRYSCKKAMDLIDTLPRKVQVGSWSLCLYGRCFYELAEYGVARNAFARLRSIEPYRLRDMEWFSTVLWHLDERAELSQLAQDLMTLERSAPQTWIATGNSYALQGEHDQAIRCFKRASLVDPGMAYTYTLTAYEALEMEEYDRAIAYYQSALRADVRHYHAWFGLGRVYQKTGRLKLAEYHFRRALSINPSNVVLYCCVGTVMERRGDLEGALSVFERSLEIDEENKMARFRKARVLMGLQRYEESLPILIDLARTSSNEASVLFLLGKLYRILGYSREATEVFTQARDLNPRLAKAIAAMRRRGGGTDESDEDDDGRDVEYEYDEEEDERAGGSMRVRSDIRGSGSVNGVMLD